MEEITIERIRDLRRNRKEQGEKKIYVKKIASNYYILSEEEVKKENITGHAMLCFDCENAYVGKCPKIGYIGYRKIENFPYVSTGIEIIGRNNSNLIVTKCDNFQKDQPRDSTGRREKKKNLAMFYYGAADEDDLRRLKRQALEKFRRQCQGK